MASVFAGGGIMAGRIVASLLVAAFALGAFPAPAAAEERTVTGTGVRLSPPGGGGVGSEWVVLCPARGEEFKIDVEEVPEQCPHCKHEGDFEIVDEDD